MNKDPTSQIVQQLNDLDIMKDPRYSYELGLEVAERRVQADNETDQLFIKKVVEITSAFIDHQLFKRAFKLASQLCRTMEGPMKYEAAVNIEALFVAAEKPQYAVDLAKETASLSGQFLAKFSENVAIDLIKKGYGDQATMIQENLLKNDHESAQKANRAIQAVMAAYASGKSTQKTQFVSDDYDVVNRSEEALKMGRKAASSNRNTYDRIQRKNIKGAQNIALSFIEHGHYEHAFQVTKPLCNMMMGPNKSAAAVAIGRAFVDAGQVDYAVKIARQMTTLKGRSKMMVAREIAIRLRANKHIKEAKMIAVLLADHPAEYAQKAATYIFSSSDVPPSDLASELSFDVDKQPGEAVALGIQLSKSNKRIYDPIQIRNIAGAEAIGLALIQKGMYSEAFKVTEPLCNATLGYLKGNPALAIAKSFIDADQTSYAIQMATRIAPLKGRPKAKSCKDICMALVDAGMDREVEEILSMMDRHDKPYITVMIEDVHDRMDHLRQLSRECVSVSADPGRTPSDVIKYGQEVYQMAAKQKNLLKEVSLQDEKIDHVDFSYKRKDTAQTTPKTSSELDVKDEEDEGSYLQDFKDRYASLFTPEIESMIVTNDTTCKVKADIFYVKISRKMILYIKGAQETRYNFDTGAVNNIEDKEKAKSFQEMVLKIGQEIETKGYEVLEEMRN